MAGNMTGLEPAGGHRHKRPQGRRSGLRRHPTHRLATASADRSRGIPRHREREISGRQHDPGPPVTGPRRSDCAGSGPRLRRAAALPKTGGAMPTKPPPTRIDMIPQTVVGEIDCDTSAADWWIEQEKSMSEHTGFSGLGNRFRKDWPTYAGIRDSVLAQVELDLSGELSPAALRPRAGICGERDTPDPCRCFE